MSNTTNLGFEVAKILGTPDEHSWSQVHVFVPQDAEKKERRGSLLAIFSLKSSQGSLTPDLGKELISRLQEEYYGQLPGWPMKRLTASLGRLNKEVKESQLPVELEITAGVLWQGVWYFACLGEGRALIKRGPTLSAVLVGGAPEGAGEGVVSASGKAEEGDLVVLGGKDFFEAIDQKTIQKSLESSVPQEIVEILSPILAGKEEQGAAAALVVKLRKRGGKAGDTEAEEEKEKKVSKRKLQFKRPIFKKIGILLLVLALGAGVLGIVLTRKEKDRRQQFDQVFFQAQERYQEAEAIAPLDRTQAMVFLKESRELIEQVKALGGVSDQEIQALKEKIQTLSSNLEEKEAKKALPLPVFFDFSSEEEEVKIGDLAVLGKKVFILDNEQGKVLRLDWESQEKEVILGEERLEKAKKIFPQVGGTAILLGDGIYKIERGKLNKLVEKEKDWGEIVDFTGWLGNLYLLDADNGQIWQYPAIKNGLGARRAWIKEDKSYSFSNEALFLIDGSIWVIDQGKIYKFYKGYQKEVFEIASLGKNIFGYTTAEGEKLYLLDIDNDRLLFIDKEKGDISREIPLPDLEKAKGLIISPDETMALIGTDSALLKVDLVKKE